MKKIRGSVAWMLVLALLLCGCQTHVASDTTKNHDWMLVGDWTVKGETLKAPGTKNAAALRSAETLGDSWQVSVTVDAGKADCARILLGKDSENIQLAATVSFDGDKAQLSLCEWIYGKWKDLTVGETFPADPDQPMVLMAYRYDGSENIRIALEQNGERLSALKCEEVTARTLAMLTMAGVGADRVVSFSDFAVGVAVRPENPVEVLLKTIQPEDEGFYLALAEAAMEDMLSNFWQGDTETGRILPTSHGYATGTDYTCLWESAMLMFGIYDMWVLTGDEYYKDLLVAEANYIRENFDPQTLETAGGDQNWACDDCAWNAMLYLSLYTVTGDQWFVDRTIGLLDDVNARWYNAELGGMYYRDDVDFMSLYEVGVAVSWLKLWEITGQQRFYDLALRSYEGMHNRLGRDDGIYYTDASIEAPKGEKERIQEASSSSFLTGNMGMAALSAKFYRLTGDQKYLDRVYDINEGLLKYYDKNGVLLNDRDAWTNGVYAAFYASEVLSLPDTEEVRALVNNTALSIATNARTDEGYYGGSWSGPAEGSGSTWYSKGSIPQQSMTTATSVLMILAAAIYDAQIEYYAR